MLRALVLALALVNLAFFAWTQGWLDTVVGVRARGDREPERLQHQVRPETIRLLPPGSRPAASAAEPVVSCLEAGPFTPAQAASAVAALKAVEPPIPADSWTDEATEQPGSWIVYMGRYPAADALAKKEDELKRREVEFEEVHLPGLDPGLALGRFNDKSAANDALARVNGQGVRTARVVQASASASIHTLRAARVDAALAARFGAIRSEAFGRGFVACGGATGR